MPGKNHKKFSRKKHIIAINISDALVNERIEETSIKSLAAKLNVSEHRLRRIVNGELDCDFIRSTATHKLWQITYEFDYVVQCIPKYEDCDYADSVHQFTSAYKCCKFLGISKATYYQRYSLQPIGEPCKDFVKDAFDREWQLVFLKKIKDITKEDWRFKQNEGNNN